MVCIVLSAGIEPALPDPQSGVLSVERREHMLDHYILKKHIRQVIGCVLFLVNLPISSCSVTQWLVFFFNIFWQEVP